jgi:hypothetical protein
MQFQNTENAPEYKPHDQFSVLLSAIAEQFTPKQDQNKHRFFRLCKKGYTKRTMLRSNENCRTILTFPRRSQAHFIVGGIGSQELENLLT